VIVADPTTEAWVESFVGDVPYRLGALLRPDEASDSTTTTPSDTTAATEDFLAALRALGADLDHRPREATRIGDANFCGYFVWSGATDDDAQVAQVKACWLDSLEDGDPAVYVDSGGTTEGDP
jgi:hypothetical protein